MAVVMRRSFFVVTKSDRVMSWVRFLGLQTKAERAYLEQIRKYARGLKRRLLRGHKQLEFNVDEESEILWELVRPVLEETMLKVPHLFDVSIDFSLYEPRINKRLRVHKNRIRRITQETWERLQEVLDKALQEGLGEIPMALVVNQVVDELETWRGARIARTETAGATNGAYLDASEAAGLTKKQWVAALDERTRETHREADGQVVAIHEPFIVGGYALQFPADPSCAAPHETINCRCTIITFE